jgi:hypothetical protein
LKLLQATTMLMTTANDRICGKHADVYQVKDNVLKKVPRNKTAPVKGGVWTKPPLDFRILPLWAWVFLKIHEIFSWIFLIFQKYPGSEGWLLGVSGNMGGENDQNLESPGVKLTSDQSLRNLKWGVLEK